MSSAVELEYDLRGAATPQHAAGLGALAYLLRAMERASAPPPPFSLSDLTLRVDLSRESLTELLKNLFQATDGRPAGAWLEAAGYNEKCLGLWRDSIWYTLRDRARSREVYDDGGQSIADDLWEALVKARDGKKASMALSGSIYLTGRLHNGEGVPFNGEPQDVLLLLCAHALAQPYRLVGLDREGETVWKGTAWAFLTPRALGAFVSQAGSFLASRPASGNNVASSEEAGLAALLGFDGQAVGAFCVALEKQGHNTNVKAAAYLTPTPAQLSQYREIAGLRHPGLRGRALSNLLQGLPLTRGVAKTLLAVPGEHGVAESKLGREVASDAALLLQGVPSPRRFAVSSSIKALLEAQTLERVLGLSYEAYQSGAGYSKQRERFRRAWFLAAHGLSYRLRSARSETLYGRVLQPLPEPGWQEQRDEALLCLSICSQIAPLWKDDSV